MQNWIEKKLASYRSWWGKLSLEIADFAERKRAIRFHKKKTANEEHGSQEHKSSNQGCKGSAVPCGRREFLLHSVSAHLFRLSGHVAEEFLCLW